MQVKNDQDLYGAKRKLAAILFADIAGYSAMMHADEEEALQSLNRFQQVLKEEVIKVEGKVVKNYGDGSLCLFKSAVRAMHAAKAIQSRLREAPEVPVRIGLHTGDVVEQDNDIYGDGINVASRLESMGLPGCVLFSKSIHDKVRNHKAFKIEQLGDFQLKNIEEHVRVYALANDGFPVPNLSDLTSSISKPVETPRSKRIKRIIPFAVVLLALIGMKFWNDVTSRIPVSDKSVAVLPFHNDSEDPSNDYFCNGMMEDILTQLQKIGDLKVISRSSVMPYKNTPKPIRDVADELGVAYVLEGSVRKSGNQVLVTTQLVSGSDEAQVWAGRYDEILSAKNIFDIQRTIAGNIASRLEAEISTDEQLAIGEAPTENLEAYDNYLRGLYFYNDRFSRGEEYVNNAIEKFEKAVELDPNFAKAHLRLAYCHDHIFWVNIDGSQGRADMAKFHFEDALKLAPEDPEVQEGQGWYLYHIKADFEKARDIFNTVSNKYPKLSSPLNALGVINSRLGNWKEAEHNFEKSISLDPSHISTHLNFYSNLFGQRKFVQAKNYLDRLLNISPENARAHREMIFLMIAVNGDIGSAMEYYDSSGLNDPEMRRILQILSRSYDELLDEAPSDIGDAGAQALAHYALASRYAGLAQRSKEYARTGIDKLEDYVQKSPNDFMSMMNLGLLYALAGNEIKARERIDLVRSKRPISKDALLGPDLEYERARILNILGEEKEAVEILKNLLSIPSRLTAEILQVAPIWDNLRNDEAFNELLKFGQETNQVL